MKYIKLFDQHSDYESYKNNKFIKPNLSYCIHEDEVHFTDLNYANEYFTLEALENTTFTIGVRTQIYNLDNVNFYYSLDKGNTWETCLDSSKKINVLSGNNLLLKANVDLAQQRSGDSYYYFETIQSTGEFNVSGNIMSLCYGDNFKDQTSLKYDNSHGLNFNNLFQQNNNLINAENLILPATTINEYQYYMMFYYCANLLTAPKTLPTKIVPDHAYYYMFYQCKKLIKAPDILADEITGSYTCQYMFSDCDSLVNPPIFNPISIGSSCCEDMFAYCNKLIASPKLDRLTTVSASACRYMFNGCDSLVTGPTILSIESAPAYCFESMFYGCSSLVNAAELPATTLATNCYVNMYSHCTSLTTIPSILPATTLAESCYENMYKDCKALTTAPELPALTLVTNCYKQMFSGCSNLNYIKALFTTNPGTTGNYTGNWVSNVSSTGTFVKNANATWTTTGSNGVPTGWTVETATP